MPLVLNPPVGLTVVALVIQPLRGKKKTPGATRQANQEYLLLSGRYEEGTQKKGFYGFPGGGAEAGETIAHTISREMREETGLITAPLSPYVIYRPIPCARKLGAYVLLVPVGGKLKDTKEMTDLRFRKLSKVFTDPDHPGRRFRPENQMAYECFREAGYLPGGRNFGGFEPQHWSILPDFPPDEAFQSFLPEQAAA